MEKDDRKRRDDRDHHPRDNKRIKPNQNPQNHAPPRNNRDRSRSPFRKNNNNARDSSRRDRSPPRGPARNGYQNPNQRNQHHSQRPYNTNNRNPSALKGPPPPKPRAIPDPPSDEDSEAEMARVMGFNGFRTTKNTKVPGNDKNYGVNKRKKSEYRQYMNRVGGFNRPLSPGKGKG